MTIDTHLSQAMTVIDEERGRPVDAVKPQPLSRRGCSRRLRFAVKQHRPENDSQVVEVHPGLLALRHRVQEPQQACKKGEAVVRYELSEDAQRLHLATAGQPLV